MGTRRVHALNVTVTAPGVFPSYTNPLSCLVWSVTEANVRVRSLIGCDLRNFRVIVPVAPGLGKSYTFTIRVNGVDTDLAVVITGAEVEGLNTTDIVSVSADDFVSLKLDQTGGAAPHAGHLQSLDVCGVSRGESWYAEAGSSLNVSGRQSVPFSPSLWDISSAAIIYNVAAVAGVYAKWTIDLSTAPGMGNSWVFQLLLNGVSVSTIVIADLATTGSAEPSLTIAPEDHLAFESGVFAGSPAATTAARAVKFVADTDGESHYCGFSVDQPSTIAVRYNYVLAKAADSYQAVESARLMYGGYTSFRLRRLYASFFSTFGAGNHTLALRKNGAGAGPSVTTATNGSDLARQALISDGDTFDMEVTPNTPANAQYMSWGLVQYSTSPPNSGVIGDYAWVHVRTREGVIT